MQLPDRVRTIEEALAGMLGTPAADPDRVEVLFHLAHRLCGSAGIYGHEAVHTAAGALEGATSALRGSRDVSWPLDALVPLVEALRRASAETPSM